MDQQVALQTILGHLPNADEDASSTLSAWRERVDNLSRRAPYTVPSGSVKDLPSTMSAQAAELLESQRIQAELPGVEPEIQMIDLNQALAFQMVVRTDQVYDRVSKALVGSDEALFEICLPNKKQLEPLACNVDMNTKSVTIQSDNPNFRLRSLQLQMPAINFLVGFGSPWVQATEYRGRLFITNGYHRCWALYTLGITEVPSLYTRANSIAELGAANAGFFPEPILMGERPPMLKDFNDDSVSITASENTIKKIIVVSAQEIVIPIIEAQPPGAAPDSTISELAG
jgi:hypothetical protein